MSKRFLLEVWQRSLPHAEKSVLAAVAWNCDCEGKNAFPSVQTVADRAGYKPRQVHNLIAKLKERGILKVEGRRPARRGNGQAHGFLPVYSIDLSGIPLLSEAARVQSLQTSKGGSAQSLQTSSAQTLQTSSLQSPEASLQSEVARVQFSTPKSAPASADEQYEQEKNRKNKQNASRQKAARDDFSLLPTEATSKSRERTLPEWIPPEAWRDFEEMRKEKRAPLTAPAVKLIVSKLQDLRESGQDIGTVLNQSTLRGYTDVFAVNGGNHAKHSNRAEQRTANNLAALDAAFPPDR